MGDNDKKNSDKTSDTDIGDNDKEYSDNDKDTDMGDNGTLCIYNRLLIFNIYFTAAKFIFLSFCSL